MSRDLPGIADAAPLQSERAVLMFGDVLGRPDLRRGSEHDASGAGIRQMFINNVSAHFDDAQYVDLARALLADVADGGVVSVQWTTSPEKAGGEKGSRGHIDGGRLLDELLAAAGGSGRTVRAQQRPTVRYRYTLNASVRGQVDASQLGEYDAPEPEFNIEIVFGPRKGTREEVGR